MVEAKLLSKQEAEHYLDSILDPDIISTVPSVGLVDEKKVFQDNEALIDSCNELIMERIENKDPGLRLSEVITAKDTAFKQNQLLSGQATANININVHELKDKSPTELLEMLKAFA